ncbi:hypothetical protein Dpep_2450 [Dethiosulfovibrio peptidovorans DSM 11002]|uniref:Phage integrase central domain-containing protein n=1 Tax=Dethiosulfovibrio peptidovorans DSM 11002 TaxID=469381 RepID=D2Z5A0_9BACT|nr:hypothetical protein Dpep_2450 [Dethiosulfovibrio peptidovorans DSM 11002]
MVRASTISHFVAVGIVADPDGYCICGLTVFRRIEDQGHIETAHRVSQIEGQVLRYGIATGQARHDITADLKRALIPRVLSSMFLSRSSQFQGKGCLVAEDVVSQFVSYGEAVAFIGGGTE